MKSWTIVGYTYRAETLCPSCVVDKTAHTRTAREFIKQDGVERWLDSLAVMNRIDRGDERSFDSGDFPKVIFADGVAAGERCDCCNAELIN